MHLSGECFAQGFQLLLYLFLLFVEVTVSGKTTASKEESFARGTYLGTTNVDVDVGFGAKVERAEETAIVHTFVALEESDIIPCLHLGQSAQGRCWMKQIKYVQGRCGLGEMESIVGAQVEEMTSL